MLGNLGQLGSQGTDEPITWELLCLNKEIRRRAECRRHPDRNSRIRLVGAGQGSGGTRPNRLAARPAWLSRSRAGHETLRSTATGTGLSEAVCLFLGLDWLGAKSSEFSRTRASRG